MLTSNRRNRAGSTDGEASNTSDGPKADYRVGYKRPPLQTRFAPGQSGNPKGRPKGTPNHRTTINRVMKEKVSVREGEKTRRVTKFEAMLQAQASKGMKGDARSAGMVITVMGKTGLLGDQRDEVNTNDLQMEPNPTEVRKPRLSDSLFDGLDGTLLTDEDKIELAGFAERIDASGLATLTTSDLTRIQELIKKGKGENSTAA